jgi:hypothetical protein
MGAPHLLSESSTDDGPTAVQSNVNLALPAHEVYAVECNKSISLINARVQVGQQQLSDAAGRAASAASLA